MILGRKTVLTVSLPVVVAVLFSVSYFSINTYYSPSLSASNLSSNSLSLEQQTATLPAAGPQNVDALDNIDDELIYLDAQGTIRVLDTSPGSHGELTWLSPVASFSYLSAGDFNLDGDKEIVGARNVNGNGQIIIYDPVISEAGIEADGWFGNVPWRALDTINVVGEITILDVGNLNLDLAGDEILAVIELENGGTGVRIFSSSDQTIDGEGWQVHIEADFTWHWDSVAVGNIDGEKTDEVVLLSTRNISDSNTSRLHVYQVDTTSLASKNPVVKRDLNTISWKSAAIGEVKNLGSQELVVVGDADGNINNNIHVFNANLSAGTMDYVDANDQESVVPDPDLTFLADVTGIINNQRDVEMFFLRSVPSSNTNSPRFFARNQGNDDFDPDLFDLALDDDNGWQAGTGADVDGDAKDEIVLMRDNKIRVYTDPDLGLDLTDYANDSVGAISTDSTNIIGANLDSNGTREPLSFSASVSGLEAGLEEGEVGAFTIQIDSNEPVDFTATLPASEPGWVTSLSPLTGQSPANLTLAVSAAGLNPGKYTTTVTVTPSDPAALGGPVEVAITLTVLDNSFSVGAAEIKAVYAPCREPFLGTARSDTTITATDPANFTVIILPEETAAAALQGLNGPISNASLNGQRLSLSDVDGNSRSLTLPESALARSADVSAAGVEISDGVIQWPSAVPWIEALSNSDVTPATLEIYFRPEKLVEEDTKFGKATLLVIADQADVEQPFNVRYTPLEFLCADNLLLLPVVQPAAVVAQ